MALNARIIIDDVAVSQRGKPKQQLGVSWERLKILIARSRLQSAEGKGS
jgi:hypothetical protein